MVKVNLPVAVTKVAGTWCVMPDPVENAWSHLIPFNTWEIAMSAAHQIAKSDSTFGYLVIPKEIVEGLYV